MTSLVPRKTRNSNSSAAAALPPDVAGGSLVDSNLPAGYDDEGSDYFVPPEARAGYYTDLEEEMLAFGEEMARPPMMGWLPGPLEIARQKVFDQAYVGAREQALARGDAEHRWPPLEQANPNVRRRQSGIDPMGPLAPRTPDTESVAIWQHRRRVDRALAQVAAVRDENTRRAAYDRTHTCSTCQRVSADVAIREVLTVKLQTCGPCEPLLRAGLLSILAREQVAEHRTRGEAVSQWLHDNGQRWAGLQFPDPHDGWSSSTRPQTLPGQWPGRPPLPPVVQTGRIPEH